MKRILGDGVKAALCALALFGCDDGDGISSPHFGGSKGGVSGGPLAGTLTVYAVDADTARAVAGATVWLGSGERAHSVGRTGRDGKLTVSGLGSEPQSVTVSASDYAAASWGLVRSSVVAIPLESESTPGTVEVTVSLPEWADLPALDAGAYRIARFVYSQPNTLSELEEDWEGRAPDCRQPQGPAECSVRLDIPSDSTALFAVVAEGNDAGTPDDPSDDAFTITRLGLANELSLRPSLALPVSIALLDPSATSRANIAAAKSPSGDLRSVVGVAGISLNDQLLVYPILGGKSTSLLVPTASGAFETAKLWAVGTASNGTETAWSRSFERAIDPPRDATRPITLSTSELMELPSIDQQTPSTFTLSSAGKVQRLKFSTANGQHLNVLLVPTQTGFEIPSGVLDEPPNAVTVEAFDWEPDPRSFEFQDLLRDTKQLARVRAELF